VLCEPFAETLGRALLAPGAKHDLLAEGQGLQSAGPFIDQRSHGRSDVAPRQAAP
jgi:hypothetical protein